MIDPKILKQKKELQEAKSSIIDPLVLTASLIFVMLPLLIFAYIIMRIWRKKRQGREHIRNINPLTEKNEDLTSEMTTIQILQI